MPTAAALSLAMEQDDRDGADKYLCAVRLGLTNDLQIYQTIRAELDSAVADSRYIARHHGQTTR